MTKKSSCKELKLTTDGLEKEALDRKRAEEELSIVYDALDSSAGGVIITDLDGKITYANPAFLRIFEYLNKAEVLGKSAAILFATDEVVKLSDVQAIIDARKERQKNLKLTLKTAQLFMWRSYPRM